MITYDHNSDDELGVLIHSATLDEKKAILQSLITRIAVIQQLYFQSCYLDYSPFNLTKLSEDMTRYAQWISYLHNILEKKIREEDVETFGTY